MRTFGSITRKEGEWHITAEPHVMLRLKRTFPRCSQKSSTLIMTDTLEVCRDLVWFMQRFRLTSSPKLLTELRARAKAHEEHERRVVAIADGKVEYGAYDLAIPARDYQVQAAELALETKGLLLADEMGLGKTVSAIAVLARKETRPGLVVTLTACPWQWQDEFKRFAPGLSTHILKGTTPYELRELRRGPDGKMVALFPDIIITNYHKLDGWRNHLAGKFVTVAGDEIQMLRNPKTAMYKAWQHISEGATYRLGLSGTPIHNLGSEMHPVIECIAPGRLGDQAEFQQEWCSESDRRGRASLKDPAAFGTYLRAQGLMLRRTRKDVGRELPGLTKIIHHVDAHAAELKKIEGEATELARIILSGVAAKGEAFKASGEFSYLLRQATGVAKAAAVADFVKIAIENDERVVLYGWHHAVYDIWEKKLEGYKPAWFTGDESGKAKRDSAMRFINKQTPLLIMSLRAGAGVDGLQKVCRTAMFGELDWSPAVHEQCITRLFRDGQEDKVAAYFLLSEEGSDPVVADILGMKRAQLEGIRDPEGAFLENLDVKGEHIRKLAQAYLERIAA